MATGYKSGGAKRSLEKTEKAEIRKLFATFAAENFAEFVEAYKGIEDSGTKCKVYIDACKYVLPTIKAVELNDVTDRSKTIEDTLKALSKNINT